MLFYTYGYCETENLYFGNRKYYVMNKSKDLVNKNIKL